MRQQQPWPGFPAFLRAAAIAPSHCDLAAIEWAWLESYHAPDAAPLALTTLSGLSEAAMLAVKVQAHPALRAVSLNAPLAEPLAEVAAMLDNPVAIIAVRPEAEVRLLPVDTATASALIPLKKAITLGNLLAFIAEQPDIDDPSGPLLVLLNAGALIEVI